MNETSKQLMLKNQRLIGKQYMELKVINQNHKLLTNEIDNFLCNASTFLCLSGYTLIKKNYLVSVMFLNNKRRWKCSVS